MIKANISGAFKGVAILVFSGLFATATLAQKEDNSEATDIEHEYEDGEEEYFEIARMSGKTRKFVDLVEKMMTEEGKKKTKARAKIDKKYVMMKAHDGEFVTTGQIDVDPNVVDMIVLDILGVKVENEIDDKWIISLPVDMMNNLIEVRGIKAFTVNTM